MSQPEQQTTIDAPRAIRVKTATGWAELVIQGPPGQGVPIGGTSGQALVKNSGTNYDTSWAAAGSDLNYDGDYASGPTYKDGEIVVYNGVAYMCVVPTSSPPSAWPGAPPVAQPPPTIVGRGTTLPSSPTDGQEYVLVDSLTNPTYQWRFRYAAGNTTAYKWEFVGGTPFIIGPPNYTPPAVGSYYTDSQVGATITIPRAGVWIRESQAGVTAAAASGQYLGFDQTMRQGQIVYSTSAEASIAIKDMVTLGQFAVVSNTFYCTAAVSGFVRRLLAVTPVRVS